MIRSEGTSRLAAMATALTLLAACAEAPRIVAEDPTTGFALYRSGRLSSHDLGELCDTGVEEILVLDGAAEDRECLYRKTVCTDLRVRYNAAQDADRPLTLDFLEAFGDWIEDARASGRKVAFRCRHGWHRTGRLAAYYRIRFEGASAAEATREMQQIGRMMWNHPTLEPQVEAYADVAAGRPCKADPDHCPLSEPDPGLLEARFPYDACVTR